MCFPTARAPVLLLRVLIVSVRVGEPAHVRPAALRVTGC